MWRGHGAITRVSAGTSRTSTAAQPASARMAKAVPSRALMLRPLGGTRGHVASHQRPASSRATPASGPVPPLHISGVAGLGLTGQRGIAVRVLSTAAAAAGTPAVSPSRIFVKVGNGRYLPFDGKDVANMNISGLLEALAGSRVFSGYFAGVKAIGECTVAILNGVLPAGKKLPDVADEAPDKVVELEASMTVADAVAVGGCTGDQLFIHVRLPSDLSVLEPATVKLTEWVKVGKRRLAEVTTIRGEVEFDKLLAAGHSVRLRTANNEPIKGIVNWRDAVEASQRHDGSVLTLISTAALIDDVSNLKKADTNRATGLESQTTHAIAHDPELNRKYAPLSLVNDGRGVTFYYKKTKQAALQVDGLVVNTQYILANECKSSLDKLHIEGGGEGDAPLMGMIERAIRLKEILGAPDDYASDPPEAFASCCRRSKGTTATASEPARAETAPKTVIPVASGFMVDSEAEKLCGTYGIELLKPQGQGGTYSSTSAAALAGRSQQHGAM